MYILNELSSLHKKVFASLAFLALTATIGFAVAEAINYNSTTERFREESVHITAFLEDNTASILDISSQILEQIQNKLIKTDVNSLQSFKSTELSNMMDLALESHQNAYESIFAVDHKGRLVGANQDLSNYSFFKSAVENFQRKFFMDYLQIDPVSHRSIIPLVRVLKNKNDEFIGLAVIGLKQDYLISSFLKAANNQGRTFFILNEDGHILFRFPFLEDSIGKDISLQPLWSSIKNQKDFNLNKAKVSIDGVLRIGSSKKVSIFPLIVGTTIPYQEVFDYWLQSTRFYIAFYLVIISLIIGVLYQTLVLHQKMTHASLQAEKETSASNKNISLNESLQKIEATIAFNKANESALAQSQAHAAQSKKSDEAKILESNSNLQSLHANHSGNTDKSTHDNSLTLVTGKLAHDFNNILTTAFGHLELSSIKTSKDHPAFPHIEKIQESLLRVKNMTKQILDFSRTRDPQPIQIDLVALILDFEAENKNKLPQNLDLILHLPPTEVTVYADPNQIYNALEHVFVNAKQALGDKPGRIDISLSPSIHHGKAQARLCIKDNGPGIPSDIQDKIFDAFFTTKKKERGTGLGLTIAHGIIKRHGGDIELSNPVENSSTQGTEFNIYLPLSSKKAQTTDVETNMLTPAGNIDKKIIVVDDEKALVDMIHEFLTVSGYQVESYTDPEVALQNFKSRPNDFAMAISDMTMPKISGDQLITEMHAIAPNMPILVASGFSNRLDLLKDYKKGPLHILAKPFDFGEFLVLVKDMLTKHNSGNKAA